ncbi:MAG: hypothetical protein Ct9H300mP4_15620 [Gammaproteobacteria bacterium]|nr:MAG: hypothetical protein Ct9H300mP4_15620 [Gammaproteobacteria bacterium]
MNNLAQRICSAVILVLLLVVLTHSSTIIPVKATVISILSLIILWEYSQLFKSRFFQIFFLILVISELLSAPFFTEYIEKTSSYLFWFLCLLWALILFQVLTYKKKSVHDFLILICGYFILLPFVASLFFLAIIPGIFLYTIIIVSIADSAAFFVGRIMGKNPFIA